MRRRTLAEGSAAAAGVAQESLDRALRLVRLAIEAAELPGAVLWVARRGVVVLRRALGRTAPEPHGRPLRDDDIFLVASLTKPLVALAVLQRIEAGELLLDDPVARFVPEFTGDGRDAVLLRHLLSHTSGLPDELPENQALRAAHAPLDAFLDATCRCRPTFAPGTAWRYASTGIHLAAAAVERLSGRPMADLLQDQVFGPLQLRTSFLGWRDGFENRVVPVQVETGPEAAEWNHNSDYWRRLGAPWGGLHATAGDLAVVLQLMLNGGSYGDVTLLSPAAAAAAVSNQVADGPPWGLGWRLARGGDPAWPDLLGPNAFGHHGATGCCFWADPASEMLAVLLTSTPLARTGRLLARLGTILAASWR